jgi:hypothetical protein
MITVQEVILDPDMIAPKQFLVLRSVGTWIAGGFQSTTTTTKLIGPVQQATDKEISMLPEADRIGEVRSFWSPIPIYTTRGYAPVPSTHGEAPAQVSDTVYTLSCAPPNNIISLYSGGMLLRANGGDYTLAGATITLVVPLSPLYATWQVTANVEASASDILVYDGAQYRVLNVYRVPGSGYYKALGTRMAGA